MRGRTDPVAVLIVSSLWLAACVDPEGSSAVPQPTPGEGFVEEAFVLGGARTADILFAVDNAWVHAR
jgi:hypothetical protein